MCLVLLQICPSCAYQHPEAALALHSFPYMYATYVEHDYLHGLTLLSLLLSFKHVFTFPIFASHRRWFGRTLFCMTDGKKDFQTVRKFPLHVGTKKNKKSAQMSTKVIPFIQHPSCLLAGVLHTEWFWTPYKLKASLPSVAVRDKHNKTVMCSYDHWDAVSVLNRIMSCLCSRAGLFMSVIFWESTVVQPKIVTHWLLSNKLLSVLNFFAFVPTPLRDNFLHFSSLKMSLEIMSECSKQLRLMLPYFSDKTDEGAAFFSKTTTSHCWDSPCCLFGSCECWFTRGAAKLWLNKVKTRQEGIPSLNWLSLKVMFSSFYNSGHLNRCVIQAFSARQSHAVKETQQKRVWNVVESKQSWLWLHFVMCHHRPLTDLHPVQPHISLVWKAPYCREIHHRPPTDTLLTKQTITNSPLSPRSQRKFKSQVIIDGGVSQGQEALSVKSTQAAVQSTVTSVDPSYATKMGKKKRRQYAALVSASWFNERARADWNFSFWRGTSSKCFPVRVHLVNLKLEVFVFQFNFVKLYMQQFILRMYSCLLFSILYPNHQVKHTACQERFPFTSHDVSLMSASAVTDPD